jgi:tRNA-2-methylthio-N6-dimethylallyladenosine synthase
VTIRQLPVLDAGLAPAARPTRAVPTVSERLDEFVTEDVALPRFHIWTLGCQMNKSDSEEMAGALLAAGCAEAPSLESADLIVINTCAIREAAEQKVIGRMGVLGRLKRSNPALRVVLTGCSVRADNVSVLPRRYPAVDLFLRPDEEPELVARLGLASATAPGLLGRGAGGSASDPATDDGSGRRPGRPGAPSFQRVGRSVAATADPLPAARASAVVAGRVARGSATHAWLPIIYGCDKTCTYCIVPFSRGPERSRPFDEVVAEARSLAAAGYQDVTLLGQNVNSYGHDLPPDHRFADVHRSRVLGRRLELDGRPDIAALLRAIDSIRTADGVPAIPRLRFVTSHPWDLGERLIAAIAECPSVCEHLHLPVQSGDDAVLHRMGRQYSVESYLGLVERLRAAAPGISLTTDVIVGFCGETEAQFERTLELLRTVRFDQVFAAAFSPRPGTPAARLPDDVPPGEKRRRLQTLLDLQEQIGLELNEAWVGRATEVLVDEIRPRRSHNHEGLASENARLVGEGTVRLAGRNRENKLVHFSGSADLLGRRVIVRVERAGPYALVGSAT